MNKGPSDVRDRMPGGVSPVLSRVWESDFPIVRLMEEYRSSEDPAAGTVVIHAGRVKLPGKTVEDVAYVSLEPTAADPVEGLNRISLEAVKRFGVRRVHVHHRLGNVRPGEDILLVMVSSVTRAPAFSACGWIVDEIKKQEVVRLVEVPPRSSFIPDPA